MPPRLLFQLAAWRALTRTLTAACGLILAAASGWAQSAAEIREFQKKAEFISSFPRFIEWPARKFVSPDSPFVIGVYGSDSITALLQEAVQERLIKGRRVVVKHLLNKEELRGCHVLFVSRSERDRLGPILAEVRRESVLTVGETDNFFAKGGIVNFVNTSAGVRFQLSSEAAAREKLVVSSKLLQLALPLSASADAGRAAMKLSEATRQP